MGVPAGPWYLDDLLTFTVVTHRFDTGALTDADSVPAYRVYEDETGTAILSGSMAKLDDANTTGFYSEQLTLSAANGFEAGKSYSLYVSAAVNSVTGGQTFNFKVIATPVAQTGDSFARLGAPAGASVSADIAAVKTQTAAIETDTQDIQSRLPAALVSGRIDASVGAMANNVMTAAAAAADLTTELQSGLATASALATVDTVVDAIQAKTDNLPSDPADQSLVIAATDALMTLIGTPAVTLADDLAAVPTATENADALLDRDMSTGTDSGSSTVRTVRQALRALRNRAAISGGTLTVYKEDDSSPAWTGAVTTAAGDPISEINPAGP